MVKSLNGNHILPWKKRKTANAIREVFPLVYPDVENSIGFNSRSGKLGSAFNNMRDGYWSSDDEAIYIKEPEAYIQTISTIQYHQQFLLFWLFICPKRQIKLTFFDNVMLLTKTTTWRYLSFLFVLFCKYLVNVTLMLRITKGNYRARI